MFSLDNCVVGEQVCKTIFIIRMFCSSAGSSASVDDDDDVMFCSAGSSTSDADTESSRRFNQSNQEHHARSVSANYLHFESYTIVGFGPKWSYAFKTR